MESLQKIFNLVVGVHEPWYAQRGVPVASVRCWVR